ncbi:unnamed protein product [Mytilus coruscus]|uniref:CCHC-type domain-containing protein n=1 Tax=Mytilus coruscus TaxID=42192 RepID=A0A6J8BT09_MYTCO|nr:unnamed protein product [Mytilus coruscus]
MSLDSTLSDTTCLDFNDTMLDAEIIFGANKKESKGKKSKQNTNSEPITHTQFCGFDDDGNEIRKPSCVKFSVELKNVKFWLDAFRFKMGEYYAIEERIVQHGQQFVLQTNNIKYVTATVYNNGMILVQGLDSSENWKIKYFQTMQIYVDNQARHAYQQQSTRDTDIKFLEIQDTSNEREDDDSLETIPKQIQISETLDNTETEIVHVRDSDKSIDFVDSHLSDQIFENNITSQLNEDVWHVSKQVKNLHEKLDQVCKIQDTNTQLLNQITNLKAALKLEQQETKLLKDEIVVQNIKIKNQEEEIITLKSEITKFGDRPSFLKVSDSTKLPHPTYSTVCQTSTPISSPIRRSPIHEKQQPKQKLKIRLNGQQQSGKNILVIGSSITKGIQTRILKQEVNINTNRGGTVQSIKRQISSIDLSPYTTLILQFGGNDVGNKISVQNFKDSFRSLLTMLNKENPSIRIIVGGLLPREEVDMMDHNQCLMDLCGEMEIDFINHVDSYVLRNGRLIPGVLYPDGVHLTKKGTSILIRNMNDVTPILANTYSENGRDKSDLNFGFQNHFQQKYSTNRNLYSQRATHEVHSKFESKSLQQNSPKSCFNCGETNHSQVSCRFRQRIRCYSCHEVAHKRKLCRKQYFTDTQGYRQPNGHVPFNYMYEN